MLLVVRLYVCSNFRILLAARCLFSSNHQIIRRKAIKIESVRKGSSLNVDAALGLAEEAGRHLRRVLLALRREMVCP